MALIRCPECGKEISSYSESCIFCGYPLNMQRTKNASSLSPKELKYYNISEITFHDGEMYDYTLNQYKTLQQIGNTIWEDNGDKAPFVYKIEDNKLYIEDGIYGKSNIERIKCYDANYVNSINWCDNPSYVLEGDILISLTSIYDNDVLIPDTSRFNVLYEDLGAYYDFKSDGTVHKYHINPDNNTKYLEERGTYKREGKLIQIYIEEDRGELFGFDQTIKYFGVYNNMIKEVEGTERIITAAKQYAKAQYSKKHPSEQASYGKTRMNSFSTTSNKAKAPWDTQYYSYACPYCGMKTVRPAKWEDKRMSIAFWGAIASPKTGARFKCDSCKRMWS